MTNIRTAILLGLCAWAEIAGAQPARITRPIDNRQRLTLRGHVHPQARAEFDQGRVAPSLNVPGVTLMLAPSAGQRAQLDQFLAEQHTPGSPNYRKWITPEEYAQLFGASAADVSRISAWLQSQGLTVTAVARGRGWISCSGTAAQVENAFQIELHHYAVDGQMHFANTSDPSVPAAFDSVVSGIRGLHDFRMRPAKHVLQQPDFTGGRSSHYLVPDDFATIYNVRPLYAAGIDGSGQKLVIAGQTQINLTDIRQFRSSYGLPAQDPQIILVPNSRNPGISTGDLQEADLDLEWSGAVARKATLLYVYAYDVTQAEQYAIDQNLAPILSSSYGACELETPPVDANAMRALAQQGNAQGITWFSPSGDNGAADCGDSQNPGLSVDLPASVPEVTAVGGTEFAEGSGQYWNSANGPTQASALSYIPEMAWNDTALDGQPAATGGGGSVLFAKPSWQTGPGVPADNARHVPDVSLSASVDHDGYLVYTGGSTNVFGGTSVPTPSFAGIAALLNQYLGTSGLGNINPSLYALAQSRPDVFHDITTGDNIVTVNCASHSRNCSSGPVGYTAGAGYDQVTGLGSVDAYKMVTAWSSASQGGPGSGTGISLLTNISTVAQNDTVFLTATVTGTQGSTPGGAVIYTVSGNALGSATLVGSAGKATATLAVSGAQLPAGSQTITATYNGAAAAQSASVLVSASPTTRSVGGRPAVAALANGASFKPAYAPGSIVSLFGSNLAPSTQLAGSVPLPISMAGVEVTVNGVAAPLYYVSSGQLNLQIPYETPANSTVTVTVNNSGQVTSQSLSVFGTAPGIFIDPAGALVPSSSARPGQIISLYFTGAGLVSPPVATGAAPAGSVAVTDLPQPQQSVTLTVGNAPATIEFIGDPWGLVGVVQVNFRVPGGIAAGVQPVVVTVGGVQSAAASLSVTN